MKKLKYPQNIILLVVSLLICFGIILFIGKYDAFNLKKANSNVVDKPISSEAKFQLNSLIVLGSTENPLSKSNFNGIANIGIDLSSGNLKVKTITLDPKLILAKADSSSTVINSIKLDPSYSSIGKINLQTGKIDLSVGIVLEMKVRSSEEKISLVLPLVGMLNRSAGRLSLKGAATIPPGQLNNPLPVEVSVSAISL